MVSCSGSEHRRPVTAQERQREREEKRRKRQERAIERKKKLREKEKKEGKSAESLGGVVLSDNDKKLLERWGRMMDKSQVMENNPSKSNNNNMGSCPIQATVGKGLIKMSAEMESDKQPSELQAFKPPQQIVPQIGQCVVPGMFHPPASFNSLPVPLSSTQNGDIGMVSVSGGRGVGGGALAIVGSGALGVVAAPCTIAKSDVLKPPTQFQGCGTVLNTVGNWTGNQASGGTAQQQQAQIPPQSQQIQLSPPQMSHVSLSQQSVLLTQPQSLPHPQQTQPIPNVEMPIANPPVKLFSDSFINKPIGLSPNGTTRVGIQDTSTSIPNQDSVGASEPLEKLCSALGKQQNGTSSLEPSHETPGSSSQTCLTDAGLQGSCRAPDIHTVTLQLSKSQVCCD